MPGEAIVSANFNPLDAAMAREGYATDFDSVAQGQLAERAINARYRAQRAMIPALVSVQSAHEMIGQFDPRHPLGILFAVETRNEDAQRVAVTIGQCSAVHAICQQRIGL